MMRILPLAFSLLLLTAACDDGAKSSNNANNVNNNTNNLNNVTEFDAVPGARCTQANQVGAVTIDAYDNGSLSASANVYDRPDAMGNEATLTDAACTFYEALPPGFCDPACGNEQRCDNSGTCQPWPLTATGLGLQLHAGVETQTFVPEVEGGSCSGPVTLPGRAFSATLTFSGLTVRLAETVVPGPLADLVATFNGDSSAPEGLDFTWTAPNTVTGAEVYTRIPINHHAGGPTYTQCAVPSSAGAFSVAQEMLTPLAVITGLEFQGLEHVLVAAAVTPKGCVEFRWRFYHYPNWSK